MGEPRPFHLLNDIRQPQVLACGSSTQVDGVNAVDASSLKYNRQSGQHPFFWKTDKIWTGCLQRVVSLVDGTS